jgi:hypothetical protein
LVKPGKNDRHFIWRPTNFSEGFSSTTRELVIRKKERKFFGQSLQRGMKRILFMSCAVWTAMKAAVK